MPQGALIKNTAYNDHILLFFILLKIIFLNFLKARRLALEENRALHAKVDTMNAEIQRLHAQIDQLTHENKMLHQSLWVGKRILKNLFLF